MRTNKFKWEVSLTSSDMLAGTKVDHFDVATAGKQDVFRLEIPMNYTLGIEILQRQHHLRCVPTSTFDVQGTVLGESVRIVWINYKLSTSLRTENSSPRSQ